MGRTSGADLVRLARVLALLGAAIGAVALAGNFVGVPILTQFVSGRPIMQPGTALTMLLAGAVVASRPTERAAWLHRALALVAGALVLAFGVLTGLEYALHVDLGVDWTPLGSGAVGAPHPGRPSPLTSVALVPLGGGLMLLDGSRPEAVRVREGLLFTCLFFAFVALVGHLYGAGALYRLGGGPVAGTALPTSLALHLIVAGALLMSPRVGLMRLVTSQGPGGVLVRRLGLSATLLAPTFGALLLFLVRAIELRDLELILALGTVAGVFFAVLFVVITAIPLERFYEAERSSRRRIHELLEHAPLSFFVADLDGHYTDVNTAGCRLLGRTREEILGMTILDLIPDDSVGKFESSRERLLAGAVDVDEWELRRSDGTFVPVEVTAKILPDGRWQGFVADITERLELRRKLRESRDFLERVLESSTEYGIIAEDLERRIVLWNEGARRSLGYAEAEILGSDSSALFAWESATAWEELRARAITDGSSEGILAARRKDGTSFSAKVVCTRSVSAEGGTAGVLAVTRDLSVEQRYLAEQEFLARAGMELAACLDSRETHTCVAELVTGFLGDLCAIDVFRGGMFERAMVMHRDRTRADDAARLLGVEPSALGPSHPIRRALASKTAFVVEATDGALVDAMATSPEHRRTLEDLGIASVMIVPLIARGQLLAVLTIWSCDGARGYGPADLRVAEALGARAALAMDNVQLWQHSRLQGAIVTNLTEGVVMVRAADGCIVYANPRFEEIFGYGAGELEGTPVHRINAPDGMSPEARAAEIMDQLRRTGEWHGEIKNIRKDGSEIWCAASVAGADHEVHGKVWVSVHSDITERRRLEEHNARALREKEVLLKEIHHRVKNNLQVISSLFALQRGRTENRALMSLLDESRMRVQSIALVHEQLYRSADLALIDFDEYLRGLVSALRSTYGAERVEFDVGAKGVIVDVEEAVPCALLVCEIVSNSLKHAFPDRRGKVSVRGRATEDGQCVLEVADDGIGIPTDFDWTTTRSLGLRLVRSLTHQLRGTVELDRSRGTRFVIRFPLEAAKDRAERTPGPGGPREDEAIA